MGEMILYYQTVIAFLKDKPLLVLFSVVYLLGVFISKFIPETLAFFLLGYGLITPVVSQEIVLKLLDSSALLLLAIIAFYSGLRLPWYSVNIVRGKLYKTMILSAVIILVIYFGLYLVLKNVQNLATLEFMKSPQLLYFMFLSLFVSGYKINHLIQVRAARGLLSLVSAAGAELMVIVSLFIFEIIRIFSVHLLQEGLVLLVIPLLLASVISLVVMALHRLKIISPDSVLLKLSIIVSLVIVAQLYPQVSLVLTALILGIQLSFYYKGEIQALFKIEAVRIIGNVAIIFSAVFFVYSLPILFLASVFLLLKNIVFRVVFYFTCKLCALNETVYRNLGAALLVQDGVPLLMFFLLFKGMALVDYQFYVSAFILAVIIDNIFFHITFSLALKGAGEVK